MSSFDEKIHELLQQSALQYIIYNKNEDTERVEKLNLFARKLLQKEFVIGFAGHFSAGKSSMINALSGEDILAASPIPTSANIVKVHKADEDFAIVYMHNEKPVKFSAGFDIKQVKELSKNGELVSQIEIGHSKSGLPLGVTVMDTPGVDSTDDAHAMSTESALHIADMVFYTMDYNHVQSELNFQFTKQLMKYNPNVYLIVNQIDKHRDSELSFDDFKQSVHHSFAAWGVTPKDIFFTSLREKDLPNNDFEKVKKIVMDSMNDWQEQLILTAENTLTKLQHEHETYLVEEKQDRFETYTDVVSEDDWASRHDILEQFDKLTRQTELFSFEQWDKLFDENRKELLTNAAIMPSDVREKLRNYLESQQEDFKVGGLFTAKKKTAEERERRKEEGFASFNHVVQSQITGHIKALMKTALKDVGALTDERAAAIDAKVFDMPVSVMEDQVQKNTIVTGDAVLNFANRVSEAAKRYFIQTTDAWKLEQKVVLEQVASEVSAPVKLKINAMTEKVQALQHIMQIDEFEAYNQKVMTQVSNELRAESKVHLEKWTRDHEQALKDIRPFDESMLKPKEQKVEEQAHQATEKIGAGLSADTVIQKALKTADIVSNVQGFKEVASFLTKKVERLQKRDFTIALFGAFSAGKSSFSNALMGERVLPVSPNPTTAAINKIRPVTPEHPHETADIHLKNEAQLLEDIQGSYAAIGLHVSSLKEAYERAEEGLAVKLTDERLNVHKSFIRAYSEGFDTFIPKLGTTLRVNRHDFEKYVAQENRSCFVDNIDFYFDSPLTRMGVTLVDTPGADSINARHTGVAFDYIRNADAILFITYFNHAFAKADREFLIQLGRVKDAFELDKMFFIVNAIDLASTMDEEEEVKGYVRSELQRFGIRFPRLYGVSSLLALKEKQDQQEHQSGMAPFEDAFHYFLNDELMGIAVQALQEEVDKTEARLYDLITQTEENLKRKDERLGELAHLEKHIRSNYQSTQTSMVESETKQELDELLYYVLQRVYYRYPDFFRESYNPSTFAQMPAQQALESALKEVLHALSFDFAQELRVTNFRLAQFVEKKMKERFKDEVRNLKELNPSFAFLAYEGTEPQLMDYTGPFSDITPYTSVKSYFKNAKSFFEKNEKEQLRDALEQLTKPDAQKFLEIEKEKLVEWANGFIAIDAEGLRQHMLEQAVEQIDTERLLLQEESRLAVWKDIYAQLKS
ncbi:GTPase [Lysinibacillus sp. 2017]|uniref:dynamin family protein n=1 Tax=unclassified Lysinibacillus TaxID=2636778 RepID=UPI000D527163|nr:MULTISPECIES: dynamin family protein [unclassified Lysinibacillus]AWE07046.1 GTPase [Lysinibacillus sp. 2017]TGN37032.1 GTPase [Lysinibacillus sp. S2017]